MRAVIWPMIRISCSRVRPELVYRISYIVRKETKRKERGFEANPNASGG